MLSMSLIRPFGVLRLPLWTKWFGRLLTIILLWRMPKLTIRLSHFNEKQNTPLSVFGDHFWYRTSKNFGRFDPYLLILWILMLDVQKLDLLFTTVPMIYITFIVISWLGGWYWLIFFSGLKLTKSQLEVAFQIFLLVTFSIGLQISTQIYCRMRQKCVEIEHLIRWVHTFGHYCTPYMSVSMQWQWHCICKCTVCFIMSTQHENIFHLCNKCSFALCTHFCTSEIYSIWLRFVSMFSQSVNWH